MRRRRAFFPTVAPMTPRCEGYQHGGMARTDRVLKPGAGVAGRVGVERVTARPQLGEAKGAGGEIANRWFKINRPRRLPIGISINFRLVQSEKNHNFKHLPLTGIFRMHDSCRISARQRACGLARSEGRNTCVV